MNFPIWSISQRSDYGTQPGYRLAGGNGRRMEVDEERVQDKTKTLKR